MQYPTFAHHYESGLAHSLLKQPRSLHDVYLADIFSMARRFGHFDGQHEQRLHQWFGFTFGEIHGSVLRRDGKLHSPITTLVTLGEDEDTKRGYQAGRDYFFLEATTDEERHISDKQIIARLHELAAEYSIYEQPEETVHFAIGDLFGQLSGHLFPWTQEEHRAFEENCIREVGYICALHQGCLAACHFPVAFAS